MNIMIFLLLLFTSIFLSNYYGEIKNELQTSLLKILLKLGSKWYKTFINTITNISVSLNTGRNVFLKSYFIQIFILNLLLVNFMFNNCATTQIKDDSNLTIAGKWQVFHVDHKGDESRYAVMDIYEDKGKYFGKIVALYQPLDENGNPKICHNCTGEDKGKPLIGITSIKNLTKKENEYTDGEVFSRHDGRWFDLKITQETRDRIKVRGYNGFILFGKTTYWERLKGNPQSGDASNFNDVVSLKNGEILSEVKAAVTSDSVVVTTKDGQVSVYNKKDIAGIKKQ